VYRTQFGSSAAGTGPQEFELQLELRATQPLLLQGDAGFSRKGPDETQASHYLSEPQLAVQGTLRRAGQSVTVTGRAWLDHEWSDQLMHPEAVGWDWIGMNLDDGAALTAFRLRRADGSSLWAGGSWRSASGALQVFEPGDLRFTPGRLWASPASGARYPLQWTVDTPAGRFEVKSLLDAQELDSRGSTGTVYWEGLSDLHDAQGRRAGSGYLEMTGYAGRLNLGS
jgi:predicted secreted hydrolase